jgi:site-specific DNA recombinase
MPLFDKVQEVLHDRNRAGIRERTHDHYLKGLLYCGECGRRLSLTVAKGKYLYLYCLGQKNSLKYQTGCTQPYLMADQAENLVEELYRRVQLPPELVERLEQELQDEIVERQANASDLRVLLTKRLAALADERQKLLTAYYANAVPLELLKNEQDRIGQAEEKAKRQLAAAEAQLEGWQEILSLAIKLAGNCHHAYLKAGPKVRRRFNEAVLKAVHIKDGRAKPEFTDLFEALFSGQGLNEAVWGFGTRTPTFE